MPTGSSYKVFQSLCGLPQDCFLSILAKVAGIIFLPPGCANKIWKVLLLSYMRAMTTDLSTSTERHTAARSSSSWHLLRQSGAAANWTNVFSTSALAAGLVVSYSCLANSSSWTISCKQHNQPINMCAMSSRYMQHKRPVTLRFLISRVCTCTEHSTNDATSLATTNDVAPQLNCQYRATNKICTVYISDTIYATQRQTANQNFLNPPAPLPFLLTFRR